MDDFAVVRDEGCKAEIPNFNLFFLVAQQDVCRLQITMHYPVAVKKAQAEHNLLKDSKGLSKLYIFPLP